MPSAMRPAPPRRLKGPAYGDHSSQEDYHRPVNGGVNLPEVEQTPHHHGDGRRDQGDLDGEEARGHRQDG
jgi:hypothetical protein